VKALRELERTGKEATKPGLFQGNFTDKDSERYHRKPYKNSLSKKGFEPGTSRKQFRSLTPSDNLHSSSVTENLDCGKINIKFDSNFNKFQGASGMSRLLFYATLYAIKYRAFQIE
jgi:hypothetical protein